MIPLSRNYAIVDFRRNTLVAPALLFYEVTNGLYQQQKNNILSPETIWQMLELSLELRSLWSMKQTST